MTDEPITQTGKDVRAFNRAWRAIRALSDLRDMIEMGAVLDGNTAYRLRTRINDVKPKIDRACGMGNVKRKNAA